MNTAAHRAAPESASPLVEHTIAKAKANAAKPTAAKPATKARPAKAAARTVCVHRNAKGAYDCNLPRHLSRTGKPSGRMCDKHEAEWRVAAKARYEVAHPKPAKETTAPGIHAIKSAPKSKSVPPNSSGQKREVRPPVRELGSGPVVSVAALVVDPDLVTS